MTPTQEQLVEAKLKADAAQAAGDLDGWLKWGREHSRRLILRQAEMIQERTHRPVQFERTQYKDIEEEMDFFGLAGMEYVEPAKRQPQWRVSG